MVRMRLQGTPEDVNRVKNDLRNKGFQIIRCSPQYKNRNSVYVRVYIELMPCGCVL